MISVLRLGLALSLLVATIGGSTASAASLSDVFDAVNGFEAVAFNPGGSNRGAFKVTGVLHGQGNEQTLGYQFADFETADRHYASCERFALIAMKDAGHYAFVVDIDAMRNVMSCHLQRR
jgi:hypothetical protein